MLDLPRIAFCTKWPAGKPSLFPSASPIGENRRVSGRSAAGIVVTRRRTTAGQSKNPRGGAGGRNTTYRISPSK
jgi:hypothetical protein